MLEKMELEFYDKDLVDISISNRNVNQSFTVANIITTFLQPLVDKSVVTKYILTASLTRKHFITGMFSGKTICIRICGQAVQIIPSSIRETTKGDIELWAVWCESFVSEVFKAPNALATGRQRNGKPKIAENMFVHNVFFCLSVSYYWLLSEFCGISEGNTGWPIQGEY